MATVQRRERFDVEPEVLWLALTDPDLLGEWLAAAVELDPQPGGRVRAVDDDGATRVGVVHVVEPAERLSFSWTTIEHDVPPSAVELTLTPDGDGTVLEITETTMAFPAAAGGLETEARALARV